ncbi:CCR4-NOT transcription complex, subunit 3 [Talaromyces stipitatus ATCC 10500]|uniref:General negative regulator of transcription subunit n=1 Tax=Talaromyces stipitatus (strain ATCC 10500 / CBS 375.48 / QM 6759 / NRRL 1006) TaxID=441959 RepID=B8MCJ7_TALSN|nr:CCR4-NOT transcription complex, subunit 3 [Talaromyces stipitatus ATCC 10500]EED18813.1 CCR4-NOT transcription complex, subunit 3 [Talaromyces stipitatus ATCC 10500]
MTSRKTQQEIEKTFKKVAEGMATFEGIYEKIKVANNTTQRDRLEENLKREIKKLQRFRDQIKTWAAGNEVKDKTPLLEQRRAIETCMEQFKAVEKDLKTKAYSKEGLSAASRLDPKEKEKADTCDFLSNMVDELQQRIEAMEAEEEVLQASLKKGKKDVTKANRLADIARVTERHKWHVNKLELLLRSLQNGGVETSQVIDLKDSIKYYVEDGHNIDYSGEDETLYDDLNLGDDETPFGIGHDNDRVSSQDTQSIPDEEPEARAKPKTESVSGRRPSAQLKSPLPVLATLHPTTTPASTSSPMKPAPPPTRLPGETLKYASAAAAAAASDRSGVGIAPLPPPPGSSPASSSAFPVSKAGSTYSPGVTSAQLASRIISTPEPTEKPSRIHSPAPTQATSAKPVSATPDLPTQSVEKQETAPTKSTSQLPNGNAANREETTSAATTTSSQDDSIYHLPPGLQDLIQSFEVTKSRGEANMSSASVQRLLAASLNSCPEPGDAEKPRHYKPQNPYNTPLYYPQEPLPIFDDHRLYDTGRIDTDTLFYIFYYQQGTYQQYLAAKSLKNQSWRFHKLYQTWFQRHEEPKMITEEFEQGTYRFFDYESTWMNRRKADFKFIYKFLEDDL